MRGVSLSNMITVVDSSTFLDLFASRDLVGSRPDLGYASPTDPYESLAALLPSSVQSGSSQVVSAPASKTGVSVVQLLTEQVKKARPAASVL